MPIPIAVSGWGMGPRKCGCTHTAITLTRGTHVYQSLNPTEEAREHSATNWRMMLDGLKRVVEG